MSGTSIGTIAGSTIVNGYCTLAELKERILPSVRNADGTVITTAEIDGVCSQVIMAASRWIDGHCGRWFFPIAATFYYTPKFEDKLDIDDLLTITSLKTDDNGDGVYETVWTTADYRLTPLNAPSFSQPWTSIEQSYSTAYEFEPEVSKQVEIVGTFGYCLSANIPFDVKEACLMQASRLYHAKDAPLGVMGDNRLGWVKTKDVEQDVRKLLAHYVRLI